MENFEPLDADNARDKDKYLDDSLHRQLKIFWIIACVFSTFNLVAMLWSNEFSLYVTLLNLLPFFFYFQVVERKNPRYITWAFIFLIFLALATIFPAVIILSKFNNLSILMAVISITSGAFAIWGIVLHAKFRLE